LSAVFDTIDELRQASALHDAVVVACSFGKDSLIALDLCVKHFKRVEALHMVYVHGLDLTAKRCEYVKQRWGVDTLIVDHPGSLEHRYRGYRCFPDASVKRKTIKQIYADAKQVLNCTAVVTGTRAAEDIGRRAGMRRGTWPGELHPLAFWRHSKEHSDLLPYLRNNNIQPFESLVGSRHGLSNSAETILYLHDHHPADYARWCEVFPFASAVVERRRLYGV
jgi:phosphoadenosine phosphosulfate reductase